jgi:hypothetical protein
MDNSDTAAMYGLLGGIVGGVVNYTTRGAPPLTWRQYNEYYALFAAMGVLSGSLFGVLLPGWSSIGVGFFGGLGGSFLLLGLGNYM